MTSYSIFKGIDAPRIKPSHNPIQLAAISNYKLAQLTFAPPDLNSLRKTAVIKNMIHDIYTTTPAEWLQQMTRWVYFTPESLENMTQEGLEEMFAQYSQTIEAFRPVKTMSYPYNDIYDEDEEEEEEEEDGQGDDLWLAEDDELLPPTPPAVPIHRVDQSPILFSQPNTTISEKEMRTPVCPPTTNVTEEKPLQHNHKTPQSQPQQYQPQRQPQQQNQPQIQVQGPTQKHPQPQTYLQTQTHNGQVQHLQSPQDQSAKQARRTSGFGAGSSKNRLSWTSDTGITSGIVSQNLANEIMSLFDMDFSVNIDLNTSPKLPELPFKPNKRRSQQRQSMDMLTSLMPAFDKIALENSSDASPFSQLFPPPPSNVPLGAEQRTHLTLKSVPQRSSSLRNRQPDSPVSPVSPLSPPLSPDSMTKSSLTRISSLVSGTGKRMMHKDMPHSPEPSPVYEMGYPFPTDTTRKTSTSSTESSDSFYSLSSEDIKQKKPKKPLPEPPVRQEEDKSNSKKYRLTKHSKKKKRRSVMESTLSKRRSMQNEDDMQKEVGKFIKIGNNKTKKQLRRVSSANLKLTEGDGIQANFPYHTSTNVHLLNNASEESLGLGSNATQNFVKRMTSFNWRIKSKNKTVQV
ncbi:hypothetical protein K501DRAFT_281529 [Backusella circina FSU 941]|nr:hypothetical protein K501DRAFT_281529 [Backusella circina FSU 941]